MPPLSSLGQHLETGSLSVVGVIRVHLLRDTRLAASSAYASAENGSSNGALPSNLIMSEKSTDVRG